MQASQLNRILLTGILMCLIVMIYQNQISIRAAHAKMPTSLSEQPVRVINNRPGTNPAGYALVPVNPDGSIDVRVKQVDDIIDVNIEEIDTYDKLNVHIKSTDNYALQNAGPIKVKE